jgi:hypothetical protein
MNLPSERYYMFIDLKIRNLTHQHLGVDPTYVGGRTALESSENTPWDQILRSIPGI